MDNQQKLKEIGWTIVDMTKDHPEDLARWKKLAMETWDEYAPIVGQDNIDKLKSAVARQDNIDNLKAAVAK